MFRTLTLFAVLVAALAPSLRADEAEEFNRIRTLLAGDKFEEAEKAYEAALAQYADSSALQSLAYTFYLYANRDEKHDLALKYIEQRVDSLLERTADNPQMASNLSSYVGVMLEAYSEAGRKGDAKMKLDSIVAAVDEAADKGNVDLMLSARELRNLQIMQLASGGQTEQARNLLLERLAAADKAVASKPDDTSALLDRLYLLKAESELQEETGGAQAGAARETFLSELLAQAKAHPDAAVLAAAAVDNYIDAAGRLSRSEPYAAEKLLTSIQEFAGSLPKEDAVVAGRVRKLEQLSGRLQDSIAAGKRHADLIGKDAVPLVAEAWVNGDPLTSEQLKGKVVLLDFWAVWCGPCIATFPHLREWREKYADKGLVIIGVTRYYNFGWNDEKQKSEHVADLSDEDEQKALLKFAEHYELKHRFMITPSDGKFQEAYAVTGIPQAVLIDRAGKIRLIRVGSGETNAREIERMIEELLDTKAGE